MSCKDAEGVTIRSFSDSDLPRLLEIAVAAWHPIFESFHALLGGDLFEIVFPDWKAMKRREIESACRPESRAHVIVAELDGRPAGFATYYLNQQKGIGEIGNNAVHPEHQRCGIGTQLHATALERMREAGMKCAKVTTGLDDSHAPARRAYEKSGFDSGLPSVDYYRTL